ncbi:non-ribosomal peptide synthetase [Vibrio spartinae]|uniref:Tyrocidine synthase III n=1 Tax=Vibrio spartinae TaxID=1918945 RepID=A0ABX6QYM6_9VIBR|nr:non-ribosomal peptide synthetase [Vibrio spartinae]QMV14112.1 Tyrocidine synthase III [Vibrio spartinae]
MTQDRSFLQEAVSPERLAQLVSQASSGRHKKKTDTKLISRPVQLDTPLELSFAQQRLWFLERLHGQTGAYTVPLALNIKGRADVSRIRTVLETIVVRHQSLRTCFPALDGRPVQIIRERIKLPFDCEAIPENADETWVEKRIQTILSEPFDLSNGPLIRGVFLSRSSQEHLLLVVMHHIIADGWSLGVLMQEFSRLYCGESLAELPIQYTDFANWQKSWLQGEPLQQLIDNWQSMLPQELEPLALPLDRPRPDSQSFNGAQMRRKLSPQLLARLMTFCAQGTESGSRMTPFSVLLAIDALVLSYYSGQQYSDQQPIVIGCPVANRQHKENESLIGFFINTLPIAIEVDTNKSFRELMGVVSQRVLKALDNQALPFEQIVEFLHPERSLDRNPVFQTAFVMQNMPLPALQFGGLSMHPYLVDSGKAKFDLTLEVIELASEWILTFEYATDLFDHDTIAGFADDWLHLAERVLTSPDVPLRQLSLVSEATVKQYCLWNQTTTIWPQPHDNIVAMFERQAQQHPGIPAIRTGHDSLSYQTLNQRANRLAHELIGQGIAPDEIVAIAIPRHPDFIVAVLAVLKAGAAFLPLDPTLPQKRTLLMMQKTNARLLLSLRDRDLVADDTIPRFFIDRFDVEQSGSADDSDPTGRLKPDMGAYVIFTSGSTGTPKGVINRHGGLLNRILWMQQTYNLKPGERVLHKTPMTFDVSIWEYLWPLSCGGTVVLAPLQAQTDSACLIETIRQQQIAVMHFVPSLLSLFLQDNDTDIDEEIPDSLRLLILSGEALSPQLRDDFCRRFPQIQLENLYGPTEAAIDVSCKSCQGEKNPRVTIGRPIANTRLYVLDAQLRPVNLGAVGELFIAGDNLARGYVGQGDLTAEKFLPDPFSETGGERMYATGDLARYTREGELEFLGRRDSQLKLRGVRIEPDEIEVILCQLPEIRAAMVTVTRQQLVAVVILQAGAVPCHEVWLEQLAEQLPYSMVPGQILIVDDIPRTSTGKLDRRLSPSLEQQLTDDGNQALVVARTVTEARLLRIWQELLEIKSIGIENDFFTLGGHSLLAIRLCSRIQAVFCVDLSLRELFRQRTVAAQAALIDASDTLVASVTPMPKAVPDRLHRYDAFLLNPVQQAYWIGRGQDFQLGNTSAHLYVEIETTGLSLHVLQQALNQLIRRHDMLRCVIHEDGTQQILAEVEDYSIHSHDLRDVDAAQIASAASVLRYQMSHQVIEVHSWPLFDIRALLLPQEKIRLHISFDLLVGDAMSWLLFCRELGQLSRFPERELPELTLSFRDYLLSEQMLIQSDEYQRARDYWQQRLDTLPSAPALPLSSSPMPEVIHFERRSGQLSKTQWDSLKSYAAAVGVTPSVLLITAFSQVLGLWAKSPAFTLNLTLFNRQPVHPDVNSILGDFTSLTLLEIDTRSGQSFAALARIVQERLLDDLDHRQYGGVDVLRDLSRRRGQEGQAIMPVVFSSILPQFGQGQDTAILRELGELVYGITQTPQIYCDHQVYEQDGALHFNWDIVETMFPAGLWNDMFQTYCALLEQLLDPDVWEMAEPVPLPLWQQQQLEQAHDTQRHFRDADMSISELVSRQAEKFPDSVAIASPMRSLTYAELNREANGVAGWLLSQRVSADCLIAVVMQKGWEQAVATLSIFKAGAAYLPIDADLPRARIEMLLAQGEVTLVLTQSWIDARIDWPEHLMVMAVDEAPELLEDFSSPAVTVSPDHLAYVIFTSGSTGQPKGVEMTHRAVVNTLLDINERLGVWSGDRIFALSSLSFDLSVYDLFGSLIAGATAVLPDCHRLREPAHWLARIKQEQVTLWNSVPALMDLLIDALDGSNERLPATLRAVLLSGDWIPLTLPGRLRSRAMNPGLQLMSLGGATEAAIWSIAYPIGPIDPAWRSIPYGLELSNQQFHVLDQQGRERPVWAVGELHISGAGLMRGYWRNQQETTHRLSVHPVTGQRLYATGDLGRRLPDGTIEFLGRDDTQVKVAGHRIELGEIETVLRRHPSVREAVVSVSDATGTGKRLAAYVIRAEDCDVGTGALKAYLQAQLPVYMIPTSIDILETFPLTGNGKVDRRALCPQFSTGVAEAAIATVRPKDIVTAPSAEISKLERVGRIVSDTLGIADIGAQTNLLELGVSSVDIVRMANAFEQAWSVRLSFREFYRQPTIAALAEMCGGDDEIHADTTTGGSQAIAPVEVILDPMARRRFKAEHPGYPEFPDELVRFPLGAIPETETIVLTERQTHRQFSTEVLAAQPLCGLFACLSRLPESDRYLYPSTGGVYALRTYICLHEGKVSGMPAGLYCLEPRENALVLIDTDFQVPPEIHDPFVNRPIFEQAAFSVLIFAHLPALLPLYGEMAPDLSRVEAGYLGQLLMMRAAQYQIGLCPIGTIDVNLIRERFGVEDGEMFVHGFLGGGLDESTISQDLTRTRL